jgi:hypothetical protein
MRKSLGSNGYRGLAAYLHNDRGSLLPLTESHPPGYLFRFFLSLLLVSMRIVVEQ